MIEIDTMLAMKMLAMGFSSRFVYEAIKNLVEERGDQRIQYHEIAARAGVSSKTVYRAVAQLRADGQNTMINNLTCPNRKCGKRFRNVAVEDGAVRCPHCKEVVFQYRFPGDETMTPKEFMALLDKRGVEATRQARRFFPGKLSIAAAGMFIPFVWTFLAQTFEKGAADGSDTAD